MSPKPQRPPVDVQDTALNTRYPLRWTDSDVLPMRFFQELKQRNVFRVATLYVVVAWLILQVADVVFGVFQLPSWALSFTATILAIGFLPAVIFAWVFEVTPEGIKLDKEVDRNTLSGASRGKRMTAVTIGLLLVAIGVFVAQPRWRGASDAAHESADATADNNRAADTPVLDRGIAVLPFQNLSADADNAFFAGGVHEEVLSNLSRIGGLRVISRTSMLRIADTDLDVRGIGARLGVSHVLEGSVRVTVQLIDAVTDEHLWSANYDETLDDIFAIQSDIAQQIANSLRATLSPDAVASMQVQPTQNQEAYDLYLRAVQESSFWQGSDTFQAMRAQLEEALRLDPAFIEARVLLSMAYGRLYWISGKKADAVFAQRAAEQLALIEAQAPDSIAAQEARAFYTYLVEHDYEATLALLEPLSRELPNDPEILSFISSSLKRLNRQDRFLQAALRLHKLDPESAVVSAELILALMAARRFPEAEAQARSGVRRFPADYTSLDQLMIVLAIRGKYAEALEVMNRIVALQPEARYRNERLWLIYSVDGLDATRSAFQPPTEEVIESLLAATDMALILRIDGNHDEEAQQLAHRAISMLEAKFAKELPDLVARRQLRAHADLAMMAAVDGSAEGFKRHREQFDSLRSGIEARQWTDFENFSSHYDVAIGQALLGDPEGAWAMLEPSVTNDTGVYTDLAFPREKNDLAFGSVAGYRDYVRLNRPVWTAEDRGGSE